MYRVPEFSRFTSNFEIEASFCNVSAIVQRPRGTFAVIIVLPFRKQWANLCLQHPPTHYSLYPIKKTRRTEMKPTARSWKTKVTLVCIVLRHTYFHWQRICTYYRINLFMIPRACSILTSLNYYFALLFIVVLANAFGILVIPR